MNRTLFLLTIFFISISQYSNAAILEKNNKQDNLSYINQLETSEVPPVGTFDELINPMNKTKFMSNLLTRRKDRIKYSELKVYWKIFIKNLDKKKQNPDRVMLDKKKLLA